MKKLVATHWITLDGFIADRDGGMSWLLADDEMGAYEIGMVTDADALLLGRKTYEDFVGYWPRVLENPETPEFEKIYASKINALHKVVASKTLKEATWSDSEILRNITPAAIGKLKAGRGKSILMYGSATVVQQLTNLGMVDEYHVLIHPVILGGGKPLFENIDKSIDLKRAKVKQFDSGVVLAIYQSATGVG